MKIPSPSQVVIAAASALIFAFLAIAAAQFFHARTTSSPNSCINNLRQIDSAKQQWALERNATSNAVPTWDDIRPYLGRLQQNEVLKCPHGGTYTIGRVADLPRCSFPHHSLDPKEQ
jgi:hypothetical protein